MSHPAALRRSRIAAALLFVTSPLLGAQMPTIAEHTRGLEKRDGYFPIYWSAIRGRLLVEVPRLGEDFLYLRSLATGIGIAGADIDRGLAGAEGIARFERHGPRVHLVVQNSRFTAKTDNAALARSVRESFPTSTLASLEIVAEEGGRVLADVTPLLLSDVMDVRGDLRDNGEGSWQLDRDRSAVHLERTRAFPRNTELEASLTFTNDDPCQRIRRHAPDGRAITVRQHHSFVELPRAGFTPRPFDPRIGLFSVSFHDFAKGFDEDYVTRYAMRHRLVKRDPGAAVSEPVEPIVYYLDRGVPEPYRTAFKQGGMWWASAFEAAGFRNAFRIEDMPDDMDPLDARYNVIQWVHRTQPSSSWGSSFVDPRTGEIIKAAVRMDSHRSLADFNIFAAAAGRGGRDAGGAMREGGDDELDLLAPVGNGESDAWLASLDPSADALEFAMARRRQHSAHEIGHTLGLAHNFIAHSYGRASAMDYPPPLIRLVDDRIDLSEAYRAGLGAYDSLAIRWAYAEFAPGTEAAGLKAIADEAMAKGLLFMTNPDEGASGSHPEVTTWTNGAEAVAELERVMRVRRALVERFDEKAIAPGEPMWLLDKRFATAYLHHRYSLGAAVKAVGGMEWRYALRGDPLAPTRIIEPARQRRALELLLDAIQPAELAIPERVLALMAPRPFGYEGDPRAFASKAAPAFDQIGAARTLATMVVRELFAPARAARLVAFADRDPRQPTLAEVVDRTIERTWGAPAPASHAALKRVAERVVLDELMRLAADADASVESRAGAEHGVRRIARLVQGASSMARDAAAHRALAAGDIARFLERRDAPTPHSPSLAPPPGTPIGGRSRP